MTFSYRVEHAYHDSQVEPKTSVISLNDIQQTNPALASQIVAHYTQNSELTFVTSDDEGPISVTRIRNQHVSN